MDTDDSSTSVHALVPLVEMWICSQTLRSIRGGRGDFSMEMSHYDEVPRM
jgi:elongation factor G